MHDTAYIFRRVKILHGNRSRHRSEKSRSLLFISPQGGKKHLHFGRRSRKLGELAIVFKYRHYFSVSLLFIIGKRLFISHTPETNRQSLRSLSACVKLGYACAVTVFGINGVATKAQPRRRFANEIWMILSLKGFLALTVRNAFPQYWKVGNASIKPLQGWLIRWNSLCFQMPTTIVTIVFSIGTNAFWLNIKFGRRGFGECRKIKYCSQHPYHTDSRLTLLAINERIVPSQSDLRFFGNNRAVFYRPRVPNTVVFPQKFGYGKSVTKFAPASTAHR